MFYIHKKTYYACESYQRDTQYGKEKELVVKAVCSCGTEFMLPDEASGANERCPHCGARYGNVTGTEEIYTNRSFEMGNMDAKALYRMDEKGDIAIFQKETRAKSKHLYTLSLVKTPCVRIQELTVDGVVIKPTASKLKEAMSNFPFSYFLNSPVGKDGDSGKGGAFIDLMAYASECVHSKSVAIVIQGLVDYPFILTAYADGQREYKSYILKRAIEEEVLAMGEASPKKALGLTKTLCQQVKDGRCSVKEAQELSAKFGPQLAERALCDAAAIMREYTSVDMTLARFMATLTTAECQRIIRYLTHDIDIYQGIDSPRDAWTLLRDYRKMCADMEVKAELCPKSLKLRHDMTQRNYKLCLDGIKKQQFIERVNMPEYKSLSWRSADGNWAIVTPESAEDIVREGKEQSHCVASYIDDVCKGMYRICFLRRSKDLNRPVLTLTVDREDNLLYYKGYSNRGETPEERDVLKQWAKSRNLTMSKEG